MVAVRGVGKSDFVEEVLNKNNAANTKMVNEAWAAAGHEGTISSTLVQKLRSRLGLAGNLRSVSKAKKSDPTRGRARSASAAADAKSGSGRRPVGRPKGSNGTHDASRTRRPGRPAAPDRLREMEAVEGEIDRLIFRLMAVGDMLEVEEALRRARRMLAHRLQP